MLSLSGVLSPWSRDIPDTIPDISHYRTLRPDRTVSDTISGQYRTLHQTHGSIAWQNAHVAACGGGFANV